MYQHPVKHTMLLHTGNCAGILVSNKVLYIVQITACLTFLCIKSIAVQICCKDALLCIMTSNFDSVCAKYFTVNILLASLILMMHSNAKDNHNCQYI